MKKIIPRIDYLTHGIHPYTAKLIPQIPHYFIKKYTSKDQLILDPFCGSGTVLLEARLLSRNAVGIDINPLAVLISEVKTTPLDIGELSSVIYRVKKEVENCEKTMDIKFPNIDYWFCEKARKELSKIRFILENLKDKVEERIYKYLLLCFSSIIRKSSYADPRIPKTCKSKRIIEKIESGWSPEPIKYFITALNKNFERINLLSTYLKENNNYVKVFHGDARKTSAILRQNGISKVDCIITSPPYINAQDYFRSYKLEIWWLGLATPEEVRRLSKQAIGTENISSGKSELPPKSQNQLLDAIIYKIWKNNRKKAYIVHSYFENMNQVFSEFSKVMEKGGIFCLITGNNNICRVQIPTYKILIQIAEYNGFKLVEIGRDRIRNRSLPPERKHNGGVIKEEWITVFQRV